MDSEEHISFASDRRCDLGEATPFSKPPFHCGMCKSRLPGLAENPLRRENVGRVHLVSPLTVLPVVVSSCQGSRPSGGGAVTLGGLL